MKPGVLVLAGLDPSGGAGILADAEAVRAMGARPFCVPTALTVQTTRRARSFEPVEPGYLLAAARAIVEEEEIGAVKIGMLASAEIAAAVGEILREEKLRGVPVILDPVFAASSGASLFRGEYPEAVSAIWGGAVVTPNLIEARVLSGKEEVEEAARAMIARGARAVLMKGGHAEGEDAVDVLVQAASASARISRFVAKRLPLQARGTGCRLASAMAARLALGDSLIEAVGEAKGFVGRYLIEANR